MSNSLTISERKTLNMVKEGLKCSEIAKKKGISRQAVHKQIKNINKKLSLDSRGLQSDPPSSNCQPKLIRLHGQEFRVLFWGSSVFYDNLRKDSNFMEFEGCTLRLSKDSVEVYGKKSFFGEDVHSVTAKSFDFWNVFFSRLEVFLKIVVFKGGVARIKLVNSHYAEVGNEFAKSCNDKGEKVRVVGGDGRIWFLIDNSFSLDEAECVHPGNSMDDMVVVKNFFNDLRENPLILSDLRDILAESVKANRDTAVGLSAVVELLRSRPEYFG